MKRNTKLSLIGIHEDLSFSKKEVWLWVRIPATPYEFIDPVGRENLAKSMDVGLATLLTSDEKNLECQLIVTTSPFATFEWAEALYKHSAQQGASEYFGQFLSEMAEVVERYNFKDRKVYLGIKLGRRSEFTSGSSINPLTEFVNFFNTATGVDDYYISDKELEFWQERARTLQRSLYTGNLHAEKVSAREIAYLTKKPFFPNMEVPEVDLTNREVWGTGELDALVDAKIENGAKYLKVTNIVNGQEVTGYRATLCFARFPDVMYFPQREPWIHFSAALPFAADFYSRFTLEPSRKVRKEINKKLAEVKDQMANMTSAGGSANIDVQERLAQGLELDYELSKSKTPWVFARHRIVVEASTETELKDRVQKVIDRYKDLDIQLIQPTGDQLDLLLESLPNDTVRVPAYYQRQELSVISAGVPAGSSNVGDKKKLDADGREQGFIGPYLGWTTSRVLSPVFLSPHAAMAQNSPPGLVITGAPGGGKSFAAFTLTYQMSLQGTWCIYIDPKGDAIPMANLPGINATVLDLRQGNAGMLDPFSIGLNDGERKDLAVEIIEMFLGGSQRVTTQQNIEISKAINWISTQPQPSLNKVVDYLLSQTNNIEAQGVGHQLSLIRELPFARLCFAPKQTESLNASQGLTIITLLGLDLPPATLPSTDYSRSNRLALGVMFLLTNYTRQLMMNANKNHPKAIAIDEAWAVTATNQGLKLVLEVARMGRSLNTALVLVSQNAGDFQGEGITNSVSTKMAFRAKDPQEIDNILKFFNLDLTEGNRDVIANLQNGECLIKDANDRIARVQIDNWNQQMNYAFETNPEKRRQNESIRQA